LTSDLRRVFEELSGQDLQSFFDQWVFQPGHPVFGGSWSFDADEVVVELRQVQGMSDGVFVTELEIAMQGAGETNVALVHVDEESETFRIPAAREPDAVLLDPNVWLLMEVDRFGRR
jgi:aminopeptidase N